MAIIEKFKPGKTHLLPESDLKKHIDSVLRLGKIAGADETEVQVDESIDALTRFANNAIHQNVSERGTQISIRPLVDHRTARTTTNRVDDDGIRGSLEEAVDLMRKIRPPWPPEAVGPSSAAESVLRAGAEVSAAVTPRT